MSAILNKLVYVTIEPNSYLLCFTLNILSTESISLMVQNFSSCVFLFSENLDWSNGDPTGLGLSNQVANLNP